MMLCFSGEMVVLVVVVGVGFAVFVEFVGFVVFVFAFPNMVGKEEGIGAGFAPMVPNPLNAFVCAGGFVLTAPKPDPN